MMLENPKQFKKNPAVVETAVLKALEEYIQVDRTFLCTITHYARTTVYDALVRLQRDGWVSSSTMKCGTGRPITLWRLK